jgi:hypothetical protein
MDVFVVVGSKIDLSGVRCSSSRSTNRYVRTNLVLPLGRLCKTHPLSHHKAACQTTAQQPIASLQFVAQRPYRTPSWKDRGFVYTREQMITDQMKTTQTLASRGPHPKTPNNAETVFARVLQLLQQNGSCNGLGQEWLKKNHTIADVQEEIKLAQEKYNQRSQSRVRKWLARFSSGVLYYGRILDVLVQHHPEYVSLAWGTTKLLFVVSSPKSLSKQQILSGDK